MSAKTLTAALIDSELEAQAIIQRAAAMGKSLAEKVLFLSKQLVRMNLDGKITAQYAAQMFVKGYVLFSLAAHVEISNDILDHAQTSTEKVLSEAEKLGHAVRTVPAITDVDKMAHVAAKAGLTDGQ